MTKYVISYDACVFVEADNREEALEKASEEIAKGNIQLELEDVEQDY